MNKIAQVLSYVLGLTAAGAVAFATTLRTISKDKYDKLVAYIHDEDTGIGSDGFDPNEVARILGIRIKKKEKVDTEAEADDKSKVIDISEGFAKVL